jgi:hypothetical protein
MYDDDTKKHTLVTYNYFNSYCITLYKYYLLLVYKTLSAVNNFDSSKQSHYYFDRATVFVVLFALD